MNWIGYMLAAIGLLLAFMAWAFFHVRERIRRGLARTQATMLFRAPVRISLKRLECFKWNKAGRAERRVAAFRALGFEDVGGFAPDADRTARMLVLRHPASGMVGIVQEQDSVGTWSDVAFFQSGTSHPVYASNVLKKDHFFLFPGDPKIHLPGASEAEVIEAVSRAVESGATAVQFNADIASSLLEEAYAAAVDARLLQPLEDWELRRLLKERGGACDDEEFTDEKLQRVREQIPVAIADELRMACREQFVREGAVTAREWQQSRDRLLIIHDRALLHELGGRMDQAAHCTPVLKKHLKRLAKKQGAPRTLFADLNATLPPWERYRKLGEVTRPVPADVYCAPEKRIST